ncbi:SDR family NAD(P)-dependent oxidoreductase [Herbaspirillum autotrophicum]|uniref:SDR family NAD(P)-dependent oxidoreductase n=1 Tax=Herbaspirillum autotrophicum TaxID=180195 RepID=UPI00067E623F|nr:SDR family oxidoreductase [Herbaspirillum autotrophicum]
MQNLFDLRGRVAVVTGAASGIGRETATVLAGMGAQVYATDRDLVGVQDLVGTLPHEAIAMQLDVTDNHQWQALLELVTSRSGRLDVLVNNAGIMVKRGFLETTIDEFRMQQRVNVESVFFGMQTFIPLMVKTAAEFAALPSIINISSMFGQIVGPSFSAYSASKGAVRLMSKAVGNEFAKTGLRVNTVHPGAIATNLSAGWEPSRDAQGNVIPMDVAKAAMERAIPMNRMGNVNEIAGAIAFLASDASRYMNCSEVTVDGGYSAI